MNYFKVKNFEAYQHYKDRNPVWIKLYNSLLNDYEFTQLKDSTKFHFIAITLLASRYHNKIPYDHKWIAQQIAATDKIDLLALENIGFIIPYDDASKMLAESYQNAIPEKRREEQNREENKVEEKGTRLNDFLDSLPEMQGKVRTDMMPIVFDREWITRHGEINDRAWNEWEKFIRYFESPDCKRPCKKDWVGAWRNWITK